MKSVADTKQRTPLFSALDTLSQRMIKAHENTLELTHQDVLNLFVRPDLRHWFAELPQHVSTWERNAFEYKFELPMTHVTGPVPVQFELMGKHLELMGKHPFVPKHPVIQTDTDPELLERVTAWVRQRVELGRDLGRCGAVLGVLCKQCTSIPQIQFFWPPISVLAEMAKIELPPTKPLRSVKSFDPEMRNHIRLAAGTIASALLLPEEIAEHNYQVSVRMNSGALKFTEHGLYFPSV